MIEPAKAEHRRATSVYTIEFSGSSGDLDLVVAAAREITTVAGSGLYGPNQAYLRVRVADDHMAVYVADKALSALVSLRWPHAVTVHTGVGPSRRIVEV